MSTCNRARRANSALAGALLIGAVLATGTGGCDWLVPLAFLGEHREKIPAEFDKLKGKTVAIVVWAAQETLFDYPHVRLELGLHIGERIRAELRDVRIVDGRRIEDHVQRSLLDAIDPEEIGRRFDCDMVVYVELLEFQMRDPDAPDFLRADIRASVAVYDLRVDPDEPKRYELEEVTAVYPPNHPLLFNETNALVVRKEAYELFAEMVARKFYKYKVEM